MSLAEGMSRQNPNCPILILAGRLGSASTHLSTLSVSISSFLAWNLLIFYICYQFILFYVLLLFREIKLEKYLEVIPISLALHVSYIYQIKLTVLHIYPNIQACL